VARLIRDYVEASGEGCVPNHQVIHEPHALQDYRAVGSSVVSTFVS